MDMAKSYTTPTISGYKVCYRSKMLAGVIYHTNMYGWYIVQLLIRQQTIENISGFIIVLVDC